MYRPATLDVATPSEREIRMTRIFHAPRPLVFEALTRCELLKRWLLGPPGWTMEVCEIDLKVGGSFRHAWHGPEGEVLELRGVHREIESPRRIVRTEAFGPDWTQGETLATVELSEQDGKTTLETTVLYSSREARDAALASGMSEGVAAAYDRLDELLYE